MATIKQSLVTEYLYRVDGDWEEDGSFQGLKCWSYKIEKRTPCGAWIRIWGSPEVKRGRKFVNIDAMKPWASTTPEKARDEFITRRKAYIRILGGRLSMAETELQAAQSGEPIPAA